MSSAPFLIFLLATICLIGLTIHAADLPHSITAETGGELDVGRPAELADRLDPLEPIAAVGQRLRVAREGRGLQLT